MNQIWLYQVWRRDPEIRDNYRLMYTTSNLEAAQQQCANTGGEYVYSYLQAFHGSNG